MAALSIPSVGQVVHYHQAPDSPGALPSIGSTPLAAVVTAVPSEGFVHLCVMDAFGDTHSRTDVEFVMAGTRRPSDRAHCAWPTA